jgi:hypothetical protein
MVFGFLKKPIKDLLVFFPKRSSKIFPGLSFLVDQLGKVESVLPMISPRILTEAVRD